MGVSLVLLSHFSIIANTIHKWILRVFHLGLLPVRHIFSCFIGYSDHAVTTDSIRWDSLLKKVPQISTDIESDSIIGDNTSDIVNGAPRVI